MKWHLKSIYSRKSSGFNLTELMTATAVVGILSTVGVASYRAQQDKAKAAEAKYSLSSLYSAEQQFRETWGRYHENLVLVQSVPIGKQNYDVGFRSAPDSIPTIPDEYAKQAKCNNWEQICNADCAKAVDTDQTNAKHLKTSYFSCSVGSQKLVKDYTGPDSADYKADATSFKAMARGELDTEDRWSIDENQNLVREQDGSN